ncbi:MAG TPA: trypsin-like peptidase domain-containing protein [Chloroflexota bacterium]|jgi:S1-C subfamily serine protease|nr:trypsin-like peptidase domain-containing protein [Chloroflexota bacterium]
MLLLRLPSITAGAVLLAAIAFAAGVAIPHPSADEPSTILATDSTAPAPELSTPAAEIARTVGPAVVSIRADQQIGSGTIFDASGLILTNAHVVYGAQAITVTLSDSRHFAGSVVGADSAFDIAVVSIDGGFNLPTVPLGTSSGLQVGDPLVAIGNPYGLDHTLTTGIVSALNRPVSEGQGTYSQSMIQTNTDINPGNSGGPLLNLNGEVVGVATLVVEVGNGAPAQGLSFAVPIDTARRVADQLVRFGKVVDTGQPYIGATLVDLKVPSSSSYLPDQPTLPGVPRMATSPASITTSPPGPDRGALVSTVAAVGPAADSGIQAGDVITSFAGVDVYNRDELLQRLVVHRPGDVVPLGIIRGGHGVTLTLTIGEAPTVSPRSEA